MSAAAATRRLVALLFAAALAAAAGPAAAQTSLDRVESLLAAGRLTEARETLQRWTDAHPPGARGASAEDRARAGLLRGRLTADVKEAEAAYLSVVLSHPRTRAAPEAMLRLGQVLVAVAIADSDTTAARRAAEYLGRLVDDYPGSEQRTLGALWLARAHQARGAHAAACGVARDVLRAGVADPVMSGLFETERDASCVAQIATTAPAAPRADTRPTPPTESAPAPQGAVERFAVQAAAVRDRSGAVALVERLRRAGFDPRITLVEGSSLHRVRIGRFANTAPAAQLARRVRDAGFEAVIVTDAHREAR